MFTCPDKEIHSVYLDGELPAGLIASYEAHVAACKECQERLRSLRAVHEVLERDKASIRMDNDFIEQGYARLMARRKYSKVVSVARPVWGGDVMHSVWRVLPVAAAAAVVAVVLPLRMVRSESTPQRQESQSGSAQLLASAPPTQLQQLGAVSEQSSMFGNGYGAFSMKQGASFGSLNMPQNASFGDVNSSGGTVQIGRGMGSRDMHHVRGGNEQGLFGVSGQQMFTNSSAVSPMPDIAAIDVFRPDLDDDNTTINIRISVPGIAGERAYTTIRVPVDVLNSTVGAIGHHSEHTGE